MNSYLKRKLFFLIICFNYFNLSLSGRSLTSHRNLESTQKITIKIEEKGEQSILSDSFHLPPSKVIIDGKEVNITDNKVELEKENTDVLLIWDEPLTDLHGMFSELSNIKAIDFSEFDTSQVTDMSNMFDSCFSLEFLDLSNFKTSKVTNMSMMFKDCESLENLEISNFDTSSVSDMSYMFNGCESLKVINISNFNTKNVVNMAGMFQSCVEI